MVAPTIRFVIDGSIISGATKRRQASAAFQKRFHHLRSCRTRAESRWLAQRKFRLFTTETALPEQTLVIGFAGGKSNDQRNRVDSSRYVAKSGTNRRASLRHCRSKRSHSGLDNCSER
jgi:hypothetical protein